MNATSLYVSTCRLVLQANPEDPGCWADLYRLIPYLRQSLSCTVCGNLLIEPYTPTETNCQHHVCRSCKGGKKKLKPSCSWCKNYEKYVENVQLRILLQCYKKLCEYIINSSIYRLMCKTTASGDTNIANMTDLIQEGAGFKDEFKSNSGLSKSAYSILPCIYASASTQTITQAININNDSEIGVDEDVSVAKSNLSNGSSIYSVTYAGSGNKMVIKRKAMLNKGEMENCENLRLIKGSNFKRPIHRRGTFRGRGRGLKEEEKTNKTGVNNCTISSNNLNNKRVNVKKKKLGCRCGNATASPGKLTCCGQRCPCYVDSKACLDCKCRGCRNPHTKEGQKVIRDPMDSANSKLQSPSHLQTEEGIPTRKTANLGFGSRRTNFSEATLPEKEEGSSTPGPPFEITFTVDNMDNIDESKIKEIMVKIEHMGKLLSQASQIPVIRESAEINMSVVISTVNPTPQFLDDLLSNPVLVTVLDCTRPGSGSTTVPNQTPNVESKKKTSKASNSPPLPTKSLSFTLIGMCNLDIGPFVSGERVIRRTLLLEPELKEAPFEIKTWVKYPRLSVIATSGETALVSETMRRFSNAIGITIESIYNVPEYITTGTIFDASLPVPSVGDVERWQVEVSKRFDRYERSVPPKEKVVGFVTYGRTWGENISQSKKYLNAGISVRCKYRNGRWDLAAFANTPTLKRSRGPYEYYCSLPPDVSVETEIKSSRRVIRWNTWKNCHMIKDDVNYLFTKLMRHRLWPVEVFLSNKSKEYLGNKNSKPEKKSKQAPSTSSVYPDHFLAFLDLSPFLHPGVTKVRVAAQLLTYSQSELLNRYGAEFISEFGFSSYSQHSITGNRRKSSSVRSKSSVRDLEYESSGILVFNEEHPTFILVEVELLKPFIPKRSIENLQLDLSQHLCLKEKMTPKKTTWGLMKQNFARSLLSAVAILCEEYSKYHRHNKKQCNEKTDTTVSFQKHLQLQENFHRMKASLEKAIVDLVGEKFGSVNEYEEKIPEIYVYLVNEMHKVTNKSLLGHTEFSSHTFYTDKLQLYAEEAFEEGDFDLAKRYLFKKLSRHPSNPDYWLDCAVFHIKLKNYDDAIEAVREALALDFSHQLGLLIYALLMAKYSYISLAETTFDILLTKYPTFIEGWMALSLVYSVFSNFEGSRVALQEAIKMECERNKEKNPEPNENENDEIDEFSYKPPKSYSMSGTEVKYGLGSFKDGISSEEPLSWTITFGPNENIFIKTTILLLKLGFYEYAGLSLAEELLSGSKNGKPSLPFIYYTSVNYYLQGRYEEAIPILQNTVEQYGKDCFLRSLMGHCFFKLENHIEAISCYEYVKEAYNRPDDIHLVYLRMGYYYLDLNKFTCAKQAFVIGCKFSPSPKLWKGVGMACLEMAEAQEAEIAFSEANYLDNTDPETWGYLALTNAFLRRIDLFQQCYLEAKKRNLSSPLLEERISSCFALHGLDNPEC